MLDVKALLHRFLDNKVDFVVIGGIAGAHMVPSGLRWISIFATVEPRSCRVLTLDALIQAKRAAERTRDLEHLIELEALKELRSSKKDQERSE